jgi:hypothetical protein
VIPEVRDFRSPERLIDIGVGTVGTASQCRGAPARSKLLRT